MTNHNNNLQEIWIEKNSKNTYVKNALKEILFDTAKNPLKYCIESKCSATNRHIILKEMTYVLAVAIEVFLSRVNLEDSQLTSSINAKTELKNCINQQVMKLRTHPYIIQQTNKTMDKKLNKLYQTHKKVSEDPIIQFIYWSVKNLPRLCIDSKKDLVPCEVSEILNNYFENMFFAIEEYNKNSKQMTSSTVRNYLSSTFIDKILESEYYQKTFN